VRCHWAESDELLRDYHDHEWGVPVHDDRLLFENLNLEGAQAGLSWLTVLRKRDEYRRVFANFDATKIIGYGETELAEQMQNPGLIRNRLKLAGVVKNARAYLAVQQEFGSFDTYIWSLVGGDGIEASKRMRKDLKKRGFIFVGPTICYAYMQGVGMVNDHEPGCFCLRL
jgi:DNA-3-methyladenine glycosylase I